MEDFSELIDATQLKLTAGDESTFISLEAVKAALNEAYRKAAALFRWPETEDALKTSTVSGQEYYDYPDNWRSDSAWRLSVGGERYGEEPDGSPMVFSDYLNWKEDDPNSTEKRWSSQWRRYFISPTPTTNGNNNIVIWGQKVISTLVNNTDETIFSHSMPECNDALVIEAVAILEKRSNEEKTSQFYSAEAERILTISFRKIKEDQAKYAKDEPMFDVPDMFGRGSTEQRTGNFN